MCLVLVILLATFSRLTFVPPFLQVKKLAESVRDVADRAQADLGLDYAWLDDVTYQDWQRYHDLVRSKFTSPLVR